MERTEVDAVLVVDVQRGFLVGDDAIPPAQRVADEVHRLLTDARAAGALVVHLRNSGGDGDPDERGTDGWKLLHDPAPGERVLDKTVDDGFVETDLERVLRDAGVRRLVVCGLLSEMCVAATAAAAARRGFGVVLAHHAHGTDDIPPGPGPSPGVPAAFAARAAEWSLGDRVEIVPGAADVAFARPRDLA